MKIIDTNDVADDRARSVLSARIGTVHGRVAGDVRRLIVQLEQLERELERPEARGYLTNPSTSSTWNGLTENIGKLNGLWAAVDAVSEA